MELSLLDTDILSEVLKQKDANVVRKASVYLERYQEFAISAITRYEVLRGLKDRNAARQIEKFGRFCQRCIIYAVTNEILDRATDLWVAGRQAGHPYRDADLIIAATASEHDRALVTGNVDDFSWIPGLAVDNWRDA